VGPGRLLRAEPGTAHDALSVSRTYLWLMGRRHGHTDGPFAPSRGRGLESVLPAGQIGRHATQRVDASAADPGGPSSTTTGASSTRTRSLALAKTRRDAHPPGFCRASISDHPAGAATHGDAVEPVRVAVYGSRAVAEGAHPTIDTRRQIQPIPARSHFIRILSTTTLRGCGPRGSTQRSRNLRMSGLGQLAALRGDLAPDACAAAGVE
jgi:hypothetical protein